MSYAQMALSVVIGLVYTPVMIRLLGKSEYGLYNTVSSTISMLSILNFGFNSSYIRYYAKYKKENDTAGINRLNGLFLILFSIIGTIALLCGLFLTTHLEWVFDEGLTAAEYETAGVLMLLLTVSLALSFPMGVFSNIISAHERYVFLKVIGLLKTVVCPLVTLPLLMMGCRSIAMVAISVTVSLATDGIYVFYVLKVLKCRFWFRGIEISVFKDLFCYTIFIAIGLVVDQINWNIDKILLGRFCGTGAVAVYSVGFSLYSYYQMFSTSVSGVFTPRIHKIVNETGEDPTAQREALTALFIKVGRIQFLLLGLVASGFVFFGKPFILNFWAGEGYGNAYYVALLLMIPASIALIQNVGIEIQRALNKHHFRSIAYAVMAFVNLAASVYLCQRYGEVGSAIGTAISLILANGLVINWYYHTHCNLDIPRFWKNILRMSLGLLIPIAFGIGVTHWLDLSSMVQLVIGIAAYAAVYCVSMWLIGMNRFEKDLIGRPLKKLWRMRHAG